MIMAKVDVGIFGLWYGNNYGSIITYYALAKLLESMGKTYRMIRNPLGSNVDIDSLERSHPLRFAKEKYQMTKLRPLSRMHELNQFFDAFLIGSDQMWNYHLSRPYKQSYYLEFADDDKIKIAFGTSFGKEHYNGPDEEKPVTEKNLKRFDAIAVRDDFSKRICEEEFGVAAETVLDPVFLCDRSAYEELIAEVNNFRIEENYIFAYILDPNAAIGECLRKIAEKSQKKVIVVFNQSGDKIRLRDALEINDDNFMFLLNPTVKEWQYLFCHAQYVVTDSFHGSCFSIIYRKPFAVLKNNGRGGSRFNWLLGGFDLLDRMAETPEQLTAIFENAGEIDYEHVDTILEKERTRSKEWLQHALERPERRKVPASAGAVSAVENSFRSGILEEHVSDLGGVHAVAPPPAAQPLKLHPDIERCRLIVSLLKAYHIRHVVISSGTRNMSLARYFESNDCFTTYNVTDERSAAYFALGLSVRLNYEPVVITCTSGTAVTNYVPGVTEAFYQRVPLIILTGDRYPCYIGQMEAQMIRQQTVFSDITKKAFQLPINWDSSGMWETRRMVSEAILECKHLINGPVHINMPINIIEHNPPPAEHLALVDVPVIRRTDYTSPESEWLAAVRQLKDAKKIMIVYGQNNPLSEQEQHYFDLFTQKYNCVVLTDHLSNVAGEYCLNPYRLMKAMTNDQFKKRLLPDLIIYVGGKRVLNCPLQGKLRSIIRRLPFWHVIDDGSLCDIYRKLTNIFGCTQAHFFRYFAEQAGDIQNDRQYLNEWKAAIAEVPPVDWNAVTWSKERFTSYYTMGRLMENIPPHSMLHLSVGNTFINSHNYPLDPSITVYCNMGTNGIDGSCSSFMGQCAVGNQLSFLMIGDLSFFYDMNSLWNKAPGPHVRILLNNDHCAGLLKHYQSRSITHQHGAVAEGWVRSLGYFKYLCAHNREEFEELLPVFTSPESDRAIFFEVLF